MKHYDQKKINQTLRTVEGLVLLLFSLLFLKLLFTLSFIKKFSFSNTLSIYFTDFLSIFTIFRLIDEPEKQNMKTSLIYCAFLGEGFTMRGWILIFGYGVIMVLKVIFEQMETTNNHIYLDQVTKWLFQPSVFR